MIFSLNECFLVGDITRDPEVSFSDSGTACARTTLCVTEDRDGMAWKTYVPVECWGKSAEVLGDLPKGTTVFLRGKLKWRTLTKDGKKDGRLEVASWSVQLVHPVAAEVA